MGNTRCFGGILQLAENRPLRVLLLLATSKSARAIFLVLVLFSTLGQAPFDSQQKRVSLTCQTKVKAIPCKDSGIPSWTTNVQADTGPHSLISRTSSHTHVAFMFLDPVSVTSMTVGGLCFCLELSLGLSSVVWIACTAVVLRIRPLTRKRTITIKHYVISGKQLISMFVVIITINFWDDCGKSFDHELVIIHRNV